MARSVAHRDKTRANAGDTPLVVPVAGTALLLIDVINDLAFAGSEALVAQAESMAAPLARLKRRATAAGVPTIYTNDNFGQWRSDFRRTVAHCTAPSSPGHRVSRRLRPTARDYFMLKPKHSGFFDMREYKIFAPADCLVSNTAADNDHAPYQLKTVLKGNVAVSTRLTFQAHGRPHHARRR